MAIERTERLVTGAEELDNYIDYLCSQIDAARNVTASPPIQARITPFGLQLAGALGGGVLIAKTKSGGIDAMSGSTPGKADVTLWDYAGSNITTQNVDVEAVNLGPTNVDGDKLIVIAPYGKWHLVLWEICAE